MEDEVLEVRKARIQYYMAMVLFGSVGLFVRRIPMASLEIAFLRSLLGSSVMGILLLLMKKPFPKSFLKEEGVKLLLSGAFLGINWIFLFEAFQKTSITSATLAYYMAPVFFLLMSSVFLGVRFTRLRLVTILLAFLGLYVLQGSTFTLGREDQAGTVFGLVAAFFYALVMLLGRSIRKVEGLHRTFLNLLVSLAVLSLYMVVNGSFDTLRVPMQSLPEILIIGFVHTGIAYALYFSSISRLEAQEVALASYLDPFFAIVFSVLFLKEPFTGNMLAGGFLILGSSLLYEMYGRRESST